MSKHNLYLKRHANNGDREHGARPGPWTCDSAFPVDCLPDLVRTFAREGAEAIGVPPEMIAVPLLVAAGAVLGRNWIVRVKQGYEQLPTLFAGVVAPPGSAKSPALQIALGPLYRLQAAAAERFQQEREQCESGLRSGDEKGPRLDHLYSTNATMEAIAPMLLSSPGLLLHFDELVAWVLGCDAYRGGKGADRQNWLSLWTGSSLKIDRKTADSIVVPRPAVAVVGGVQPDILHKLHDAKGLQDGFIDRILWVVPELKPMKWTTATTSPQTEAAVDALFARLRRRDGNPCIVTLDAHAAAAWAQWFDENQRQVWELTGLERGFGAKLPNQVARIALILHALQDPDGRGLRITEATMELAIALGEYFRAESRKVIPLITGKRGDHRTLKSQVGQILQEGSQCSRTDLHKRLSHRAKGAELSDILAELASEGKVVHQRTPSSGGRPADQYQWVSASDSQPTAGEGDEDETWLF
jgi:hypothetical protein